MCVFGLLYIELVGPGGHICDVHRPPGLNPSWIIVTVKALITSDVVKNWKRLLCSGCDLFPPLHFTVGQFVLRGQIYSQCHRLSPVTRVFAYKWTV